MTIANKDFMNEIVTCSSGTSASVYSLKFPFNSKLHALAFMLVNSPRPMICKIMSHFCPVAIAEC